MKYKIIYYLGKEISIKTKVETGFIILDDGQVFVVSKNKNDKIVLGNIQSISLFRLHGLGRMLKIEFGGGIIFVSVVRFCIANLFASINFFATGELKKVIEENYLVK